MKLIAITRKGEHLVTDLTKWVNTHGFELKEPTEDETDYFLGNMKLDSHPIMYISGLFRGRLDYSERDSLFNRDIVDVMQLKFDDNVIWESKRHNEKT